MSAAARYRKLPVEIEAVPCDSVIHASRNDWSALPKWIAEAYERGDILFLPHSVEIATLEGRMVANRDDWIIRGVAGEIYPCKPKVFQATYEKVKEPRS